MFNKLDEYKSLYIETSGHSEQMNSKLGNYLTSVAIMGTGAIYLYKQLLKSDYDFWFMIVSMLSIISFCISTYLFVRLFLHYTYAKFPIEKINGYSEKYKVYVQSKYGDKWEEYYNEGMEDFFSVTYLSCAAQNHLQNIEKNNRIRKFVTSLLITFVIEFVSYAYMLSYI